MIGEGRGKLGGRGKCGQRKGFVAEIEFLIENEGEKQVFSEIFRWKRRQKGGGVILREKRRILEVKDLYLG